MKTEKTMDMNKDSRLSRTYEADGYHFVTFKIADSPTAKVLRTSFEYVKKSGT
jgi:hypothetical protein